MSQEYQNVSKNVQVDIWDHTLSEGWDNEVPTTHKELQITKEC